MESLARALSPYRVTVESEVTPDAHRLYEASGSGGSCVTLYAELKPIQAKRLCRGNGSTYGYRFDLEIVDSVIQKRPRSGSELGLYDWEETKPPSSDS